MKQVERDIAYGGNTYAEMKEYLRDHYPDLAAELSPMPVLDALDRLNKFTGLDVQKKDLIDDGSQRFLDRLKEMDNGKSEQAL